MKMKNMLSIAALLLAAAGSKAQETIELPVFEGEFVLVRVVETRAMALSWPRIVVSDGVKPAEIIRIKPFSPQNAGDNLDLLAKVFNDIRRQGYLLTGPPTSVHMDAATSHQTDYIFEKEAVRE